MKSKKIFTRLDRRHTGFRDWKYFLNKPLGDRQTFHIWRAWCWNTWGPSKELHDWINDTKYPMTIDACRNPQWCWQNDQYATRIYLRDDKELSQFLFQWSQ